MRIKGEYGHVLLIGGNSGMTGSVMLAAEAAARTGCGTGLCGDRLTACPHAECCMPRSDGSWCGECGETSTNWSDVHQSLQLDQD